MKFATPLIEGRLIQRYKRFLADVSLADGSLVTVACPNTGTMLGLTAAGSRVYLSRSDSATRKYPHTWEMIENDLGAGPTLVGINTGHPNKILSEAIGAGAIKPWSSGNLRSVIRIIGREYQGRGGSGKVSGVGGGNPSARHGSRRAPPGCL